MGVLGLVHDTVREFSVTALKAMSVGGSGPERYEEYTVREVYESEGRKGGKGIKKKGIKEKGGNIKLKQEENKMK